MNWWGNMSDKPSENTSLFRIDLERAMEALELALAKKPKTTKNIVPYCYDMSNALDGLAFTDLSLAANELATIFQVPALGKLGLPLLAEFQALVRLGLRDEDGDHSDGLPMDLANNTLLFFQKLHQIQATSVTEQYVDIVVPALQAPPASQAESELPSRVDFTQQSRSEIPFILSAKSSYPSVQEMIDQSEQIEDARSFADAPQEEPQALVAEKSTQAPVESLGTTPSALTPNPFEPNHLLDSLEATINQLDSMFQEVHQPPNTPTELEPPPPDLTNASEEPFFIAFPFSTPSSSTARVEEPTGHDSSSLLPNQEQKNVETLDNSVSTAMGLKPELPGWVISPEVTQIVQIMQPEVEQSPVPATAPEALMEARATNSRDSNLDKELILEEIEDPMAELTKLTEQFSLAAQSLRSAEGESTAPLERTAEVERTGEIVVSHLPAEASDGHQELEAPFSRELTPEPVGFSEVVRPLNDGMTLADLEEYVEPIVTHHDEDETDSLEEVSVVLPLSSTASTLAVTDQESPQSGVFPEPPTSIVSTEFNFNLKKSLNRLQQARGMIGNRNTWQIKELDRLLEEQQNALTQSVQISLVAALRGLADVVDVGEVYADPNIVQRLLSVLSILPVQKNITAVQQHLVIFIDLMGVHPSEHQLHLASNFLAQISGSIEVKTDITRITIPSSLLRMQMYCYKRNESLFAVPLAQLVDAHQFSHEEAAAESTMWDIHGAIDGPHHRIQLRCGALDYTIYCFETIGNRTINYFDDIPSSITKEAWLGGVGVDGQDQVFHCVFFDRFTQ